MTNEVRLIDANACLALFDEKFKETRRLILEGEDHLDNLAEGFKEASDVLYLMPTIDPESLRPKGRWDTTNMHKCSNCGEVAPSDDWQYLHTTFCPNCGAKMEG